MFKYFAPMHVCVPQCYDGCELPCEYRDLNPDPLQNQMLLTAWLSL